MWPLTPGQNPKEHMEPVSLMKGVCFDDFPDKLDLVSHRKGDPIQWPI